MNSWVALGQAVLVVPLGLIKTSSCLSFQGKFVGKIRNPQSPIARQAEEAVKLSLSCGHTDFLD